MTRSLRTAAATLVVGLALQGDAYGEGPVARESRWASGAAAGFDVVVLRPLGFAALVVSTVALVPAALLMAPNGKDSLQEATSTLVTEPARNVFQRPLGDF